MKIKELLIETTFNNKDPMEFTSPSGSKPQILFQTSQGSRYLIFGDGMVLRHKSFHSNTGGEDQGLQGWSDHIEFFDPKKIGGTTFTQAVAKAVEKNLNVALGIRDNKRVLLIFKDTKWQVARISDIFKYVASGDEEIVAEYSPRPKLNWDPLDYDLNSNQTLKRVHPGSAVTHGIKLN